MKHTITLSTPDLTRILYGLESAVLRQEGKARARYEQLHDRLRKEHNVIVPVKKAKPVKAKPATIDLNNSTDRRLLLSDGTVLDAVVMGGCSDCYWYKTVPGGSKRKCVRPTGETSPKGSVYACGTTTRTDATSIIWVKQP